MNPMFDHLVASARARSAARAAHLDPIMISSTLTLVRLSENTVQTEGAE